MYGDYSGETEVVVLCPTRENAAGALEMVQSFYQTIHRIGSECILVIDDDEPERDAYLAIPDRVMREHRIGPFALTPVDPPRVMVVPGGSLTKATNEAVALIWDTDNIIGHVGDDHRFRTPGWDTVIRDTLKTRPGVAYPYDGFRSAWASSWFTNAIIPRTLGWLAVPGSMHLTIDDVFMDIGAGLGRLTFLEDVLVEHLHPAGGKVPWRPIVASHYAAPRRKQEEINLDLYRRTQFEQDIAILRVALDLPRQRVDDLSPGQTFRRNLPARWALPAATLHVDKAFPTEEELTEFAGKVLRINSAAWVAARRAWHREHRGA